MVGKHPVLNHNGHIFCILIEFYMESDPAVGQKVVLINYDMT